MKQSNRPCIITGNWKMYKTVGEAANFVKTLAPLVQESQSLIYLAVPFTVIKAAADQAKNTKVVIGAQNMNDASEGAFTGEICARMLKDVGAQFVILGHSERRRFFNESSDFVNKKVKRALVDKLQPIVCVGETLQEREQGLAEEVVKKQLQETLAGIENLEIGNLVIAYEPVWAIGTDKTATPKDAQEMHQFCRQVIVSLLGSEVAEKIVIQYGGSVKPENAKALLEQPDVDGLLVGGASLSVDSFVKIINDANIST